LIDISQYIFRDIRFPLAAFLRRRRGAAIMGRDKDEKTRRWGLAPAALCIFTGDSLEKSTAIFERAMPSRASRACAGGSA